MNNLTECKDSVYIFERLA